MRSRKGRGRAASAAAGA
uniref:Uncharacterized protein n=1 Tax=Arundo donax TaxID=35708 RepID=A0A0A9EQU4_ARUDO